MKAWSEGRPDVVCESIRPGEITWREPPRTIEPTVDDRFFSIAFAQTVPERYLARIPHARLIGEAGLVVLPDGAFASEVTFGDMHLVQQPAYFTPLPKKLHRKCGNYFSLLSLFTSHPNYYHWLHDALLRLHLMLPHLPEDVRFIVPPKLRSFQLDSLALLGISPEQVCMFSGQELWELEALYFAPMTARSASNSPAAIRWFRELAWSEYGLESARVRRRLYVSRRRTHRHIVNEPEVEDVLKGFGFETCLFEDLSFREQVSLMAETEAIASASGAGLTNILFAPPGAKVLVMVEPVQISWPFWTMSEAAGHEYWYALGETVRTHPPPSDPDVFVPVEKLAQTLEAMFAST